MTRRRQKRKTPLLFLVTRAGVAVALLAVLVVFRSSLNVRSAVNTDGATEQLKTNGVITIAPGGASDSVMKLGNHGNMIASTGSIYLRPNGTTAGSRFTGNDDGTQDLIMTGNVTVAGGIVLGEERKTIWPEPDSWMSIVTGSNSDLYPNDTNLSVKTGEQPDNQDAFGLSIYENSTDYSALSVNNSVGRSISFGSPDEGFNNVDIRGALNIISGYLYVKLPSPFSDSYKRVWTADNDGKASGLSADVIDGTDTYFANCGNSVCICAVTVGQQNQSHCQNLDTMLYYIY
ncbi:MAG: hypothetical protein V1907_01995 [Candidatus Kerfeldbacteria bacterium]